MALNLRYMTGDEFASRFWRAVRVAYRNDKVRYTWLLWWLTKRLVAGDITDAQARVTFNTEFGRSLNATQWTNLRANSITPAHDEYEAIINRAEL
jgi:hypothetical protein